MLGNETTARAGLRSMSRVNQFDQHASYFSFVGDKLAELAESPRLMSTPLAMSNRSPRTDALQILKGDSSLRVLSLRHKPFANHMVGISAKPRFLTRQSFKMPLSRFSTFVLEVGLKIANAFPDLIHSLTRIDFTIAVNGKVNNTEVNTNNSRRVIGCLFGSIQGNSEVEYVFTQDKVSLPNYPSKASLLVFTNANGDNLSTFKRQDGNLIQPLKREEALVIDHSRMGLKHDQFEFVPSVSFGYLTYSPDCHLRRQAEILTEFLVGKVVKFYLSCCRVAESKFGKVVAGFIKPLHCLKQRGILFLVRSKFDHKGLYHTDSIDKYLLFVKYFKKGGVGFLCQLKQAVSAD